MIELTRQGRALLFVSHAMDAVQLLCDTAVWLDQGRVRECGDLDRVLANYHASYVREQVLS